MAEPNILNAVSSTLGVPIWLLVVVIIWSLIWKGLALWKAARKNHMAWFIALLLINTMGIFEILYIYVFSDLSDKLKKQAKKSKKQSYKVTSKKTKKFPTLK